MDWRPARSLTVLFGQLDRLAPARSKASDGTIGDASHIPPSDHLPDAQGVVRAGDFTHDPVHGADMRRISEALRQSRDGRIKYVIFDRSIFSAINTPWVWREYTGTNPHFGHMHLSVVADDRADDTRLWTMEGPMLTTQDLVNVKATILDALTTDVPFDSDGVRKYFASRGWSIMSHRQLQEYIAEWVHTLRHEAPAPKPPAIDPVALVEALVASPAALEALATAMRAAVGMIPTAGEIAREIGKLDWHGEVTTPIT